MDHIDSHGGRFVTILPRTRKEDRQFRDRIATHPAEWTEAHRRPAGRIGDPDQTFHTTPAPAGPSVEGYRIIWVRSSTKIDRDTESRRARIAKGIAAIDDLNQKLAAPRNRTKTKVAVQVAADTALKDAGADRWVDYTITEHSTETLRQEKRGRPGPNTRYRKIVTTHHRIVFTINEPLVAHDAASDGCFPLITNDTTLTDPEVLAAYRYQPNLERRNHILKDHQTVAPVYLQAPHRIEALLLCQFLALLTGALLERHIRTAMADTNQTSIALYPEHRPCTTPSAQRILQIFAGVARHHLTDTDGNTIQTFQPDLTPQQHQILELLDIPTTTYTT